MHGLKQYKPVLLLLVIIILLIGLVWYVSEQLQIRLDQNMPDLGLMIVLLG